MDDLRAATAIAAGLAVALLTSAGMSPAAYAIRVPAPGGPAGPLNVPPQIRTFAAGGMPGWQMSYVAFAISHPSLNRLLPATQISLSGGRSRRPVAVAIRLNVRVGQRATLQHLPHVPTPRLAAGGAADEATLPANQGQHRFGAKLFA